MLGRIGDVINCIPIAYKYSQIYGQPIPWVVTRNFASPLERVSYVQPIYWDGDFYLTINEATHFAKQKYSNVLCLQTGGKDFRIDKKTASFADEHYRLGRLVDQRGKVPHLFDKRSDESESKLLAKVPKGKPLLLYSVRGHSSPYPQGDVLCQALSVFAGVAHLIDLGGINADNVVDLLALYDKAAMLITIDTATLHLAPFTNLPYIALTSDYKERWGTSTPIGNCKLRVDYSQTKAMLPVIIKTISDIIGVAHPPVIEPPKLKAAMYHCYCDFATKDPATLQRNRVAKMTWKGQEWQEIPVKESDTPRLWREDGRTFQYIRDVISFAAKKLNPDDILIYTNTDICVRSDCDDVVRNRLNQVDAAYSFRRDFFHDFDAPIPDATIPSGNDYSGSDLYAFRVKWWRDHESEMADLILGGEAWDPCLRRLMHLTQPGKDVVFKNLIYHRKHASYWEVPENRTRLLMQKYCITVAREWLLRHGENPSKHGLPNEV